MKIKNKLSGFSLFELLVVISIIGIIVAVGAVSYSSAQKKARDVRRREDLQSVQKAFEQYYTVNNSTYGTCAAMAVENFSGGVMPTDPKNTGDYINAEKCQTYGYCVNAQLEETAKGNCGGCDACDGSDCEMDSGDTHYCVINLQ